MMWRNGGFRAYSRWGQCQHYRPKTSTKKDRLIAPVSTFGAEDDGHSGNERETCNDSRCFARKPEISLLETVGWVGTVLTVGLNVNLHSKRFCTSSQVSPLTGSSSSSSPSSCSIYSLFHSFLLKIAFASPFNASSLSKCVLPDEPRQRSLHTDASAQREGGSSLNVADQLEGITREYLGQWEMLMGSQLYSSDAVRAVKHFEKAAALGAGRAHYNLGVCYEKGTGVAPDEARAALHYQRAAEEGHGAATYNLGIFYLEGRGGLSPHPEKALALVKKASALGVPEAKSYMGQHYLHQSAWDKALPLFREAAQKKDVDASYFLGYCYEKGLGVRCDPEAAARHYGAAAAAGDRAAAAALRKLPSLASFSRQVGAHREEKKSMAAALDHSWPSASLKSCAAQAEEPSGQYLDYLTERLLLRKVQ